MWSKVVLSQKALKQSLQPLELSHHNITAEEIHTTGKISLLTVLKARADLSKFQIRAIRYMFIAFPYLNEI